MTKSMNRFLQQDFIKFHGKLRFQVLKYYPCGGMGMERSERSTIRSLWGVIQGPLVSLCCSCSFFRPCMLTSCPRYSRGGIAAAHFPHITFNSSTHSHRCQSLYSLLPDDTHGVSYTLLSQWVHWLTQPFLCVSITYLLTSRLSFSRDRSLPFLTLMQWTSDNKSNVRPLRFRR